MSSPAVGRRHRRRRRRALLRLLPAPARRRRHRARVQPRRQRRLLGQRRLGLPRPGRAAARARAHLVRDPLAVRPQLRALLQAVASCPSWPRGCCASGPTATSATTSTASRRSPRWAATSSTWSTRCAPTGSSSSSTGRGCWSRRASPTSPARSSRSCSRCAPTGTTCPTTSSRPRRAARCSSRRSPTTIDGGFDRRSALARAARLVHRRARGAAAAHGGGDRRGRRGQRLPGQRRPSAPACAPPPATTSADAFLLAAGAWTTPLAKMIGVRFPMQAGKGYSFFVKPSVIPTHSILLADVHVGCTPLGDQMRIGGTMEFSGLNTRLDERRIADIVTAARTCFLALEVAGDRAALGRDAPDHRPTGCRSSTAPRLDNIYVATGYAMQGVTLAPPAGRGDGRVHRDRAQARAARAVRDRAPAGAATTEERPWLTELRVVIIGSGNIGSDLMAKVAPQPDARARRHGGHRPRLARPRARRRGGGRHLRPWGSRTCSARIGEVDLAFDATSAHAHADARRRSSPSAGSSSVDLTPAALGPAVIPAVNLDAHATPPTSTSSPAAPRRRSRSSPRSPRSPTCPTPRSSRPSRPAPPGRGRAPTSTSSPSPPPARSRRSAGPARGKAIMLLNPADPPMLMRNAIYADDPGGRPEAVLAAVDRRGRDGVGLRARLSG